MPTLEEILAQGWQVHQSGNVDAAMQLYRGVLRQMPDSAETWVYLGIAQFDTRDFAGSVQSYRRGIELKPVFPIAWNNLGNSLRMLGEIDEAESCFARALQQQPGYLSALKNRGTLWVWNGDIERGLASYADGLRVDPDNAELHRNLGVIHLLMGNFQRGFAEYRWRWRMPGMARPSLSDDLTRSGQHVPVWSGQDVRGKTVLLYPEQGLGDSIQFLRVAAALRDDGARVLVTCAADLIPLFSTCSSVDQFLPDLPGVSAAASGSVPAVDYQGTFLEILDGLYQRDQKLFHGEGGGYLRVPDALAAYWSTRLPGRGRFRVGVNWQGNRDHHADVYRSVPLETLRPIAAMPEIELVSLQFGDGVEQLDTVDFASSITRLPADLDRTGRFTDTAAIVTLLDAVVTTDTSIAHLAGSLGVPTHVMLGRVPDWRWLLSGETTPWYTSMTLHRQSRSDDWSPVVQSIMQSIADG